MDLKNELHRLFLKLFDYILETKPQTHEKMPMWNRHPKKPQNAITLLDQGQDTYWEIIALFRDNPRTSFLTDQELIKIVWDYIFEINGKNLDIQNISSDIDDVVSDLINETTENNSIWEVIISLGSIDISDEITINESMSLFNLSNGNLAKKWNERLTNSLKLPQENRILEDFKQQHFGEFRVNANHSQLAIKYAIRKLKKLNSVMNLVYKSKFITSPFEKWDLNPNLTIFVYDKQVKRGSIAFQRLNEWDMKINLTNKKERLLENIYNWNYYLDSIEVENNEFLQKIDLVIKWYGNLIKVKDVDIKIILCCTILECLFIRKNEKGVKSALIAFRISIFYFRLELNGYIDTYFWLDLYRARNNLIHGSMSYEQVEHEYKMEFYQREPYRKLTENFVSRVGTLIMDIYQVFCNLRFERSKARSSTDKDTNEILEKKITEFLSVDEFINWIDGGKDKILMNGIDLFAKKEYFRALWENKNYYRSMFIGARKSVPRNGVR